MSDTLFLKDSLSGAVPVEVASEIIKNVKEKASILNLAKKVPMKGDTLDIAQLTGSGSAYWTGEGEQIKTTIPTFEYPELKAKKLAVIVPLTREKVNDTVIDVMSAIQTAIADAFATAIDTACIVGTSSPFTTNIIGKIGSSNKFVKTSNLDKDISKAMGLVEANKYNPTNILMPLTKKKDIRDLSNSASYKGGITVSNAFDTPIEYVRDITETNANVIVGDFSKCIVGTREEMEYQILDQATITMGTGSSAQTVNLAQNDMIAVKCTMRMGFVVVDGNAFSMVSNS